MIPAESVIISDVGGTNTRFQFYRSISDEKPTLIHHWKTNEFKSYDEALEEFTKEIEGGFDKSKTDIVLSIASKISVDRTS